MKRSLMAGLQPVPPDHANKLAIVFAPHQDDETLGCGGTILKKRGAGAPVTCVFLTDGATSHRRFMAEVELIRLRKQEAHAALAILGVGPEHTQFLDFPDSKLGQFHEAAVAKVVAILQRSSPEEVFVPYRADRTPDHEATYRIVSEAIGKAGRAVQVYEYPVWLWNQWPWVPLRLTANRDGLRAFVQIWRTRWGRKFLQEFRTGVFIGDVLAQKRQALNQHRTQMTVLQSNPAWPTLLDVSDGTWLDCFFQEYEVFRCHQSGDTLGT